MISKKTIDDILTTARLEEVISEFVSLKKSGSNYKGLSPFNDEKTPSFMVSPSKQIWKDFSSGKAGGVVTFLMEHEQFSYPEALRFLANKYGIEIIETNVKPEDEDEKKQKESLFSINEIAKDFFKDNLLNTDEGKKIGLSYFKERGFTNQELELFNLGYSPVNKNAFTEYALDKGYKEEILKESGLSLFNEYGSVDRFRERVIFPIYTFSGRVVGLEEELYHQIKKLRNI